MTPPWKNGLQAQGGTEKEHLRVVVMHHPQTRPPALRNPPPFLPPSSPRVKQQVPCDELKDHASHRPHVTGGRVLGPQNHLRGPMEGGEQEKGGRGKRQRLNESILMRH